MTVRVYILILAVGALLSACHDTSSGPGGAGLVAVTDRPLYEPNERIALTVSSGSASPLCLPSCCQNVAFYVDRLENGIWKLDHGVGIPCLALCPGIVITVDVNKPCAYAFTLEKPGTYRLRIPYGSSPENPMEAELTTNEFVVR